MLRERKTGKCTRVVIVNWSVSMCTTMLVVVHEMGDLNLWFASTFHMFALVGEIPQKFL